ncbi:MAG TPA: hypothetical protein PL151_12005 [Phycisphaerae bacterium]|nr:hypothetical protein [Phycisphaerae bacterium]HOJ72785.1 hypothetical protein [Phycisphaerae bacterium]HOM51788.1 hypothetical protein [Phycisphaerae bacterium]HON68020.1 hypothetical protein [Phycisphaerae bacterium]HOQ84366.1 hypothetical protein [Phycisphaerae bacterium]
MKRRLSPGLGRLLFIKGVCRAGPPVYVLWSIVEWCRVDWRYAIVFGALTLNYVLVYALTWTYPALMQGPWRVRPWQTLLLLANAVVLPIMFWRTRGHLPWIFFVAAVFCAACLYIGTAIYIHLNEKLPMGAVFAKTRDPALPKLVDAPEPPASSG